MKYHARSLQQSNIFVGELFENTIREVMVFERVPFIDLQLIVIRLLPLLVPYFLQAKLNSA